MKNDNVIKNDRVPMTWRNLFGQIQAFMLVENRLSLLLVPCSVSFDSEIREKVTNKFTSDDFVKVALLTFSQRL